MNKEYGLTLRFLSGTQAKNDLVLIMDDDIVPSETAIASLIDKINNKEGVYGLYGRNFDSDMKYDKSNSFGEVPVVLTRCLICKRDMCEYFMKNFRKYETQEIRNSKPYWNGEDILFSMLSIQKYKKLPEAIEYKHYNTVLNYMSLNAISFGKEHDEYRKKLTRDFVQKLNLDKEIKKADIKYKKSQFRYFYENGPLEIIISSVIFLILFVSIVKY